MSEWQPIETAPKDGTRVLIYSVVDGANSSIFEHGTWQGLPWRPYSHKDYAGAIPTHWMPLPEPPK